MNIKIKDYPLIKAIETGKCLPFSNVFTDDQTYQHLAKILESHWSEICETVFDQVFFLSHTYMKALESSWEAFNKLIKREQEECCSLLNELNRLYIDNDTFGDICFALNCNISAASINAYFGPNGVPFIIHMASPSETVAWTCEGNKDGTMSYILQLLCMEKYAPVDVRLVKPGQRVRPDFKMLDTIENKSDKGLVIHIRDSRWFTTIVRNEDFNVRGFFRLQPKKRDGEWTRELIYIKPFVKHGYHRVANVDAKKTQ